MRSSMGVQADETAAANFMKQLLRYTGFVLAIVAADVWTRTQGPASSASFAVYGCSAATAAEEGTPPTPTEQHQALLKEFQSAASTYFQSTNDAERRNLVARADKATVRLLELVEKNPKERFALEALTQIVTQEYWLNNHTSHPGWGQKSP